MFEDRTYEKILEEMLAQAPDGVDTRQGSIYFDAVAACAFQLSRYYVDASILFDLIFIDTATGEYLDRRGQEYSVYRNPATNARYHFIYEGTTPQIGTKFFTDGLYFSIVSDGGVLYLDADEPGPASNHIQEGTPATPLYTVIGLTASSFGALVEPGADQEGDEPYRERVREKIAGPAQNGNKQHYKTWCEEVAGVGRARILPLWAGENTVKGVLYDNDGLPASQAVIDRVQEHIDPGGTGLGEGKANIGAHFTAAAAIPVSIKVSFSAILVTGATPEQATEAATEAIRGYFKELSLDTPEGEAVVVRVSRIGALLYELPQMLDYSGLTLNGQPGNLEIAETESPVLEGVEIVVTLR